jgi:iron(II)-dependent oxidoreductase
MADAEALLEDLEDTRARTLELVQDLSDDELMGPRLSIVNPLLWELGHLAYFHEYWGLRCLHGVEGLRADADRLWDSIHVAHDERWDLPLPSRAETLAYLDGVRERIAGLLRSRAPTPHEAYLYRYAIHHECMHAEAFTYARQTLGYPAPSLRVPPPAPEGGGPWPGDVEVPGGRFLLGALPDAPFAFDNEKWAHEVAVEPFAIARAPVTQAEFAAFVQDGGYEARGLWSEEGWRWRVSVGAERPVWWREAGAGFERRDFDRWVPLEPDRPVVHVCAHEADAWCRWAGRRLPTEAEWELSAGGFEKRRFPWGDEPPGPRHANLSWAAMGCVDVGAHPAGDSPFGCRQMLGNVWEWTATTFGPYPGFRPDMYREYSQDLFGTTRVLRGGAWPTQRRLIRVTWRNYHEPHRRDVWAGFRTCPAG